jgi:predicted metal-dependent phosphoesterase TrpH
VIKINGKADLHMHSTASDGSYTPEELMKKCAEAGLTLVSLTDHDTTQGIAPAKRAAEELGMKFINGIELSSRAEGKHVDILGYGIDPDYGPLQEALTFQQNMRVERMVKMLEKCNDEGMAISFEEVKVYAKGDTLSRPHVAKVMVEKGYSSNVKEAFRKYLADGKPCYVPKEKEMTPAEAIELIHEAGGLAIVAHPVFYSLDDEIFKWLVSGDLDGVEVYHRDHDKAAVSRYKALAEKAEAERVKSVLVTGGSDFHHESFGRAGELLGETKLPYEHGQLLYNILLNKV